MNQAVFSKTLPVNSVGLTGSSPDVEFLGLTFSEQFVFYFLFEYLQVTCTESWNSPTTFPDNLSRYVFRSLYFRHHMKYWILMSFKITYAVKETSLLCMVKSYPIHEVPHPTPYRLFFNRFGVSRHRSIFNSFGIPMYQNWHSNKYTAVRKSATTQSHRLKYDQLANLPISKLAH